MKTERSSFEDSGVDAITATREDQLTGTGLDDTASMGGSTSATGQGRAQEAAGGVAERVSDTAAKQANIGLTRAGDMIEQVAGAVRQTGEQIRGQQPQIAGFTDTAAEQLDRASRFVRESDAQGLLREAESFARRQPAVFLGGALALGLVASRFLKASPQGGSGSGGRDYRYGMGYGNGAGNGGTRYGNGSNYGAPVAGGYGLGSGYSGSGSGTSGYGSSPSGTGVEHDRV